MKKRILKILFLSLFWIMNQNGQLLAQINSQVFSVRISLQSDFQKAAFIDTQFPYEFKEHKATQKNWGIDLLIEKKILNKWSFYYGIGYFRNQFNFKRAYNHQLLNIGRDSLPIGTSTNDYIFDLLRFPIAVSYRLLETNKININLSIENNINFSFHQVYNGGKPFPDANNKYSKFRYYGNSILIVSRISKQFNKNSLIQIEPYVRFVNIYKRKDPILYEYNPKPYSRFFDGLGLSVAYSIIFKTKKP